MASSGRVRMARWGGAVLVALAPLPWLGVGTAAADGATQESAGATLSFHAQGAASCAFTIEGSTLPQGLTGSVAIVGKSGSSVGRLSLGPADASGYAATGIVNGDDLRVPSGNYTATLTSHGKTVASTQVFKVNCANTYPTSDSPTPSNTETSDSPTPSNTETSDSPTPSNTETSDSPTPTDTETSESATPSNTETTPTSTPSQSTPIESESSEPVNSPSASVKATRLTHAATLPHTGPDLPIGAALASSLLLIVMGALLLMGPGRVVTARYFRKH